MDTNRGVDTASGGEFDETAKPAGRGCGCWVAVLVVLILLGAGGAYFMGTLVLREEKPLPGEAEIADLGVRYIAVPSDYTDMRIPATLMNDQNKAQTIAKGKDLFGAQCALCHGAKGKGDAQLGMTQYPPAADLTSSRTQSKSDGQLYWIISHGINLSGMPAWGKNYGGPNDENEVWSMVAYIRTLPSQK